MFGVRVLGVRTPGVRVPGVRVVLLLVMGLGLLGALLSCGVDDMDARLPGRLLVAFDGTLDGTPDGTPNESRLTPVLFAFAFSPTEEAEVDACDARFLTDTDPGK